MYRCLAVLLAAGSVVSALPSFLQEAVQATPRQVAGLIVDLDYAQYQGSHNAKFDTNVFLGIRYAAPPKRWQLPESPQPNRTSIIQATSQPPRCPQSNAAPLLVAPFPTNR
ncbi:hypothetical protein B0T17DRAFT_264611 [Bombardia bombarda]|uniref:Carboxylesterase type B domain-containing protein n=1 Tax=Bombardia bombarda TaxID=252184 RepID=A0AA39X0U9_9PEZI|nr:hypothetical protein B0T17DRAFT_264611 [Bombardia bombarda]